MRVVDIMLALPSLLLALVLVAVFGPSIGNAALALTFVALPHYVRLTRAAVLVEVNRDYVTASRVAGAGDHMDEGKGEKSDTDKRGDDESQTSENELQHNPDSL
jgi:hypothetical protein